MRGSMIIQLRSCIISSTPPPFPVACLKRDPVAEQLSQQLSQATNECTPPPHPLSEVFLPPDKHPDTRPIEPTTQPQLRSNATTIITITTLARSAGRDVFRQPWPPPRTPRQKSEPNAELQLQRATINSSSSSPSFNSNVPPSLIIITTIPTTTHQHHHN